MNSYEAEIAALPNSIAERIDQLAADMLARINLPGYTATMETLGSEVHHLIFGGTEADPGGPAYPLNAAEWLTVRAMPHFEGLLADHLEARLEVGIYEDPTHGMAAAVCATLADMVANRVIEMNDGYDTPLTPGDPGPEPA